MAEDNRYIIVHTVSGSIYEFDTDIKMVRRLGGNNPPTERQGKDGEWKGYNRIFHLANGSLLIEWIGKNYTGTSTVMSACWGGEVERHTTGSKGALQKLITK